LLHRGGNMQNFRSHVGKRVKGGGGGGGAGERLESRWE